MWLLVARPVAKRHRSIAKRRAAAHNEPSFASFTEQSVR